MAFNFITSRPKAIFNAVFRRNLHLRTDNPLETKIYRRRQLVDPNVPDFEKQECLKWTRWILLRDVKRRILTSQYCQMRTNLAGIYKNKLLPGVVRELAKEDRFKTPRDSSLIKLQARCALSGRARGVVKRYRISRIIWRDAADHGMLSGVIRAKWG